MQVFEPISEGPLFVEPPKVIVEEASLKLKAAMKPPKRPIIVEIDTEPIQYNLNA
jgi:hypothetical protein